jgi:outer membrane protein insertion porin family
MLKALKQFLVVLLILMTPVFSWAEEAFVIRNIKITGLQRTEIGTVMSYLPVKSGDQFNEAVAQEILKRLFDTGFFDDIHVRADQSDLVIEIVERPIIAELTIKGASIINGSTLKKALRDNGIGESLVFDPSIFDAAIKSLKSVYFENGKYDVAIAIHHKKLEDNRLAIAIDILEGKTATIRSIQIIGNKVFTEKTLQSEIFLTSGGLLSWYKGDNQYAQNKLHSDIEAIKLFYQDHGFMNANINSSQVLLSPDKKSIDLVINLYEGKLYKIGQVNFLGDFVLPEVTLKKLIQFKQGDRFSQTKLNDLIRSIVTRLGDEGYAFVQVDDKKQVDESAGVVNLEMHINPGHKVYVRHINISGNLYNKDETIRREMRLIEGGLFNKSKVERSRERILLLGYFGGVDIQIKPIKNILDQVDLEVIVKEIRSGQVNVGIQHIAGEGFVPTIAMKNPNIFGSGKSLDLILSANKTDQSAALSYVIPYFTEDGISLAYLGAFEQHDRDTRDQKTLSAELDFGIPITEINRVDFAVGIEHNVCDGASDLCKEYEGKANALTGRVSWSEDTRNAAILPSQGYLSKFNLKAGLPSSDLQYYIVQYDHSLYSSLNSLVTLVLHGALQMGDGYGNTKNLPFFKNFYAGGISSIRGFKDNSLGERAGDADGNEYLGGSKQLVTTAELRFPIFGLTKQDNIRMSIFADAASLWGPKTDGVGKIRFEEGLRWSIGLGLIWISPMTPVEFSYTLLRDERHKDKDEYENFQFYLGIKF